MIDLSCKNNASKFSYSESESALSINQKLSEKEYRSLLKIYPSQPETHLQLKKLRDESRMLLSKDDLKDLDTYAKRIRGEILFAGAWLLCEGQSEYLQILDDKGITLGKTKGEVGFKTELSEKIRKDKVVYARLLAEKLRASGADVNRVPKFIHEVLNDLFTRIS